MRRRECELLLSWKVASDKRCPTAEESKAKDASQLASQLASQPAMSLEGSNDGSLAGSSVESVSRGPEPIRRVGVDYNDNIELMLMHREANKKYSIKIPEALTINGNRIRKVCLTHDEYEHLMIEVKGNEQYVMCRPDLEIHTVGILGTDDYFEGHTEDEESGSDGEQSTSEDGGPGTTGTKPSKEQLRKIDNPFTKIELRRTRSKKTERKIKELLVTATDESDGDGLELLFDPAKSLYIVSQFIEDQIILLLRTNFMRATQINLIHVKCNQLHDTNSCNFISNLRQRTWRRFLRIFIVPVMNDIDRITQIEERYQAWQIEQEEKRKAGLLKAADDLSSSEDSEDSDYGMKKNRKKGNNNK